MVLKRLTTEAEAAVDEAASVARAAAEHLQRASQNADEARARADEARARIAVLEEVLRQVAKSRADLVTAETVAATARADLQAARQAREQAKETAASARGWVAAVAAKQARVPTLQKQAADGDATAAVVQPQIETLQAEINDWPTDSRAHPLPGKAQAINKLNGLKQQQTDARAHAASARAELASFGDLAAAAAKAAADQQAADMDVATRETRVLAAQAKDTQAAQEVVAIQVRLASLQGQAGAPTPEAALDRARAASADTQAALVAAHKALADATSYDADAREQLGAATPLLDRARDVRAVLAAGGPQAELTRIRAVLAGWRAVVSADQAVTDDEVHARFLRLSELDDAELSAQVVATLGSPPPIPAVLLPVRLETRFAPDGAGGTDLLVRIYPDQISIDSHEPELTNDEAGWGAHFWTEQGLGEDADRAAWSGLVARFGAPRAAWVVRATAPSAIDPGRRCASWTRATRAALLPDRWLVIAYQGGQRIAWALTETAVRADLAVGPTPGATRQPGATTDEQMRWLVDFDEASAAGMAARLTGVGAGLDRVVVLGVRPEPAGAELARLLDAHHFTAGLGLLADGTATNATKNAPVTWTSSDPDAARSWRLERGTQPQTGDGSAGALLATALGVPTSVFAAAAGASATLDPYSAAMNSALWPATWGSLLTGRLKLSDQALVPIRDHFVDWVRARGCLPVMRIGQQPYGVLPVTALSRWAPSAGEEPLTTLAGLLTRLRDVWTLAGRLAVAADPSPEGLMARSARSTTIAAHGDFEVEAQWFDKAASFMGLTHDAISQILQAESDQFTSAGTVLGVPLPWQPRVLQRPAVGGVRDATGSRRASGWPPPGELRLVDPDGDPDGAARPAPGYLDWLATAQPGQIDAEDPLLPGRNTLLYLLARQASRVADVRGSLNTLAKASTDELTALMLDTLDLASARYDAWVSSFATRRLASLHLSPEPGADPSEVLVGAYGFVEGPLVARDATTVAADRLPPDEPPGLLLDPTTSGGYLHAPSLPQAVTAAVLRSGHIHHLEEGDPFAVDLSSRRVRLASDLADGVRQGIPLSALLGYRLARTLYESGRNDLLVALAELAPLSGAADTGIGAAVATVDGERLVEAYLKASLPFQRPNPPAPWDADATARAHEALGILVDALDAFDDATVAEAVHHTLQGNYGRAAANLVARSRGDVPPPELEFLRTPRTGIGLTFRVLMLTPPSTGAAEAAGWSRERPRVRADPSLGAWAERLLGPAGDVTVTVEARDRATAALLALPSAASSFGLDVLGLAALDLVALADRASELDTAAAAYVLDDARRPSGVPADAVVQVLPDAPSGARSLRCGDLLALARAASRLLATSRPADARDLAPPGHRAATGVDLGDLATRAGQTIAAAQQAASAIEAALGSQTEGAPLTVANPAGCRTALAAAWACGVPGALPDPDDDTQPQSRVRLAQAGVTVHAELVRRIDRASVLAEDSSDTRAQSLVAAVQALLGDGFRMLPLFSPADPHALAEAVATTDLDGAHGGLSPVGWLGKAAAVRAPVAALLAVCDGSDAIGTGVPLTVQVGQLPAPDVGKARWIGMPTPTEGLAGARLGLALVGGIGPSSTSGSSSMAGLLVDEWVEVVPSTSETTGVTFAYDAPGSQAPQAVLVAVPPDASAPAWDITDLEATVSETVDLAIARTADLTDLDLLASVPAAALGDPDVATLVAVRRAYLPAVSVPTPSVGDIGLDPDRLVQLPADYGVVVPVQEQLPNITATNPPLPLVVQGTSVGITATGTSLEKATWTVTPNDNLLVTAGTANPTTASVTVTAAVEAVAGVRTLVCTTPTGSTQLSLKVEGRARIETVTPNRVAQDAKDISPALSVTGYQLKGATVKSISVGPTNPRTDGLSPVDLTARVTASADDNLTLALTLSGSPPLPREPNGPFVVWLAKRTSVGVGVVIETAVDKTRGWTGAELTIGFTVEAMHWREKDKSGSGDDAP